MTTRRHLLQLLATTTVTPALAHAASAANATWRLALPGYRYEFPRDHLAHPEFQTEWWYFTGNLRDDRSASFGYELTFFRQAREAGGDPQNPWHTGQLYLAHFALADVASRQFLHRERLNRQGPGLAGTDTVAGRVWNGNWEAKLAGGHDWQLRATDQEFAIKLDLQSAKQPVLHGENGVHQKAAEAGRASHYISLTRLETTGSLSVNGRSVPVRGLSWMDHEFFTSQMAGDQVGWDWFSIQLDDGTELMIYRLRRRDGSIEPLSGGSFVHSDGRWERLQLRDFTLRPLDTWASPRTGGVYPTSWDIVVPRLDLSLTARPMLSHQELVSERRLGPSYWEGLMEYQGSRRGKPLSGRGYLELTGYAGDVDLSGQNRGGLTR